MLNLALTKRTTSDGVRFGKAAPSPASPVSLTQALPLSMTAAAHSCLTVRTATPDQYIRGQTLACSTYDSVTSLC